MNKPLNDFLSEVSVLTLDYKSEEYYNGWLDFRDLIMKHFGEHITSLKKVKGNLIDLANDGYFDVIVHGCNCFHTMGSGIAKEIKRRIPDAYYADLMTEYGSREKLGTMTIVEMDYCTVINAYTQYGYGTGKDYFEYDAFQRILNTLADTQVAVRFGFPYIGMGRAGGDKEKIMAMLEDFAKKVSKKGGSVTLVEYEAG